MRKLSAEDGTNSNFTPKPVRDTLETPKNNVTQKFVVQSEDIEEKVRLAIENYRKV